MSVHSFIDYNKNRFLEELAVLCGIPSVAATGQGIEEAATWVTTRLAQVGAVVETYSMGGSPIVYAELGPHDAARTLLIYNHYDVQPPEPLEAWDSPPFTLTVRDGKLFARGVADNKANFLSRVQAVEMLRSRRAELPIRIRWIVEGEEEVGSPSLAKFAAQHGQLWTDSDGCLWEAGYKNEHGQMTLYSGLKGIAYFELRANGANSDAHSAMATLLPNAAWRLAWALATLKDEDEKILIDGLMDNVAFPDEVERHYVEEIPFDAEEMRRTYGIESFVTGVRGQAALFRHLYQPTCTICGISSGYTGPAVKTVLPNYAFAKLEFRLVPNLTPNLVHELLREHLDRKGFADIEVIPLSQEHPVRGQVQSNVVQAAIQSVRSVSGVAPVVWPHMAATGPMHPITAQFGIPAVGFGTGYHDSRNHAPNENIRLEDYLEGIAIAAAFFEAFARG